MTANQDLKFTRRQVIQKSALVGAGALLASSFPAAGQGERTVRSLANTPTKGYAARDKSGKLSPWAFERRAIGDDDILIDIKFSGVCHSDIHTMLGHWGPQTYPQVPGHEIAGIVSAVGKRVTKFKVGDQAGVGCMVDSCLACESCKKGEEHHCEKGFTGTYGAPDKTSPTGITQGGYATNIVVKEHFAIHIPSSIRLQDAAPLLCAGITTFSPLMKFNFKTGDKIGIAGIGGLGHIGIKLAVSKGAEVYAFTTSPEKVKDILAFGAKEAIVVDSLDKLKPYIGKLDYLLSTIPYNYNVGAYADTVKPYGYFTQVGQPIGGELTVNNFNMIFNRVNFNGSLIGGIPETQQVMDYCAQHKIYPQIEMIKAEAINDAWDKVIAKQARYRYVIDAATI